MTVQPESAASQTLTANVAELLRAVALPRSASRGDLFLSVLVF